MEEYVILVDEKDNELGQMEKLEAHRRGILHRAFSIFIFNDKGEMLLQQRAAAKYHAAGLWSNACCSHPRKNEPIQNALSRKLEQELGIACDIQKAFEFKYRCDFENGLIEHELDHIYIGHFSGKLKPNPSEISAWKYMGINDILADLAYKPKAYTPWFRMLITQTLEHYHSLKRA